MQQNPYYGFPGLPLKPATPPSPPVSPRQPREGDERLFTQLDGDARLQEWAGLPLGRHGRALLAEIESYLYFFAIARGGKSQPSAA